jgi:hypothetical protein
MVEWTFVEAAPGSSGTVHRSLKFLRCGTTGQPAAFQTMAVRGHFRRRF